MNQLFVNNALRVLSSLGIIGMVDYDHCISNQVVTKPETVHGIKVNVELTEFANCKELRCEVLLTLPETGSLANVFIDYVTGKEKLKKYDGYFGIDKRTVAYSPWNNNYLVIRTEKYPTSELDKAIDSLITLSKKFFNHLGEYASLRRWSTNDPEVIAKAKEIIANADFHETDVDREERAHWLVDRNSFVRGWFNPFNDHEHGTFDTLWPSSVDYAAKTMGNEGTFEYAVSCLVLVDPEYIAKAREACIIRKETRTFIY
jgi:hypothetical protein